MADDNCLPQLQACRTRLTRLQANGRTAPGPNMIVTDALITFGFTPVFTDGTEIEDKNACDEVKVNYKGPDSFKRGDVAMQVLTVDPYLQSLASGGDLLEVGDRVGFAAPIIGAASGDLISVEVWTKRINNGALASDYPYAWWVYPQLQNLRPDAHTHENASLKPSFVGQAVENPNWVDGPLNDWPAASDRVYQWLPTDTLPDVTCGWITVAAS